MSYNSDLQTNNTNLQSILDTTIWLPDKSELPEIHCWTCTLKNKNTVLKYLEEDKLPNLTGVKSITIPEGQITKITCGKDVIWEEVNNEVNITYSLSNVTLSDTATTATIGSTYQAVVTTTNGYPAIMTVTMGGDTVIDGEIASGSTITIPNISANILIGAFEKLVNLLPTATDTDRKTIYNGIGYYNGKRWSSSGGKITTGNNTTSMTGFFDCKPGDILRVYNYTQISGTAWYIITFDANQKVVKCVSANGVSPNGGYVAPGYSETVLTEATYGNFTSIRLSWGQFNADSIVTINQEIPH